MITTWRNRAAAAAAFALTALAVGEGGAQAASLAKDLFGAARSGSAQAPAPLGSYATGCLAGGVEIPETGPGWQAVRLSRNRNWGHPEAYSFLSRLAEKAQAAGWPRLLVGDVSQPRGGPMVTGHASHQIGLDLDIWLKPGPEAPMSRAAREDVHSASVVSADKRGVNGNWTNRHRDLLRAASQDSKVARIFVNAAIKAHLCATEPVQDRAWLRKLRPWWGHDAHMHVRLACPAGADICKDQSPVPAGDGCDSSMDWWFSDEALNPPPPKGPIVRKRDVMTLEDLPVQCAAVLEAD